MKQYVVVHFEKDYIQCIGIFTDYFQAVGKAYAYATEFVKTGSANRNGDVTPIFGLEGETGVGLTFHYGDGGEQEADMYILEYEED